MPQIPVADVMNERDKAIEDALDCLGLHIGVCAKEERRGVMASITIIKGMRSQRRQRDLEIDSLTLAASSCFKTPSPFEGVKGLESSPSEIPKHTQPGTRRDNH